MSAGVMNTIDFIMGNETMADLWQKYQKKYFYAADITWVMVINAVNALAEYLAAFSVISVGSTPQEAVI